MRRVGWIIGSLSVLIMLISCSTSPEKIGDAAYEAAKKAQGDERRMQLKKAYIQYKEAISANPETPSEQLKRRFVEMSLARVALVLNEGHADMEAIPLLREEIETYMDPGLPAEMRQEYANFLTQLADSSINDRDFQEALRYIDKALQYAGEASEIKSKREKLVHDVANENYEIAEFEYKNGKKGKDEEALLRAQYYASVALFFDSTHAEAKNLLSNVRKENVGTYSAYIRVIEGYEDTSLFRSINKYDILLAVPTKTVGRNSVNADVHIYNYSYNPLRLKSESFYLVDSNGKKYKARHKVIEPELLDLEHEAKLKLSFPRPSGKIVKLVYEYEDHYAEKPFM
jgi:hypothetical protein